MLLGGLAETPVEGLCVEVTTGGSAAPTLEGQVAERIASRLGYLGLEVSSGGCHAALRLSVTGHRTSATYQEVGECWSGVSLSLETTLVVDGQVQTTWSATEEQSPPYSIGWCPDQNDPIDDLSGFSTANWLELSCEPFADMFGNPGHLTCAHDWEWSAEPTDEELAWLAFMLARKPEGMTSLLRHRFDDDLKATLLPLVPYLIGGFAEDRDNPRAPGDDPRHRDSAELLAEITGQSFDSPEGAWAWWEQQG